MSIQWTFIAGYLYFEVAVVFLMIAPLFSPRRWYQFFNSRLFCMVKHHAAFYFYSLLGVLCLFLFDAIREIRKYSASNDSHLNLATELKWSVKLFRAQRNFYITGFAIFLSFVIRRLISMLIIQHELTLKAAQIIKDAEATVKLAKNTVLTNTMQAAEDYDKDIKNELVLTKSLLAEEKLKTTQLVEAATNWRLKYEEVVEKTSGKGDE